MSSSPITRVTLFKISEPEDQQKLITIYKQMPEKAKKDGKPYIKSLNFGPTKDDQRNQGYTLAVVTMFESLEDFKYYDTECEAHAELKQFANTVHKGVMMVFFESAL